LLFSDSICFFSCKIKQKGTSTSPTSNIYGKECVDATRNVLMQKCDEIARLDVELQNTEEALQTALQERDEWMHRAKRSCQRTRLLISQLTPMEGTNSRALNMEGIAADKTHPCPMCRLCSSRDCDTCMLILPCQHQCACKSCGVNLTVCPICGSAKSQLFHPMGSLGTFVCAELLVIVSRHLLGLIAGSGSFFLVGTMSLSFSSSLTLSISFSCKIQQKGTSNSPTSNIYGKECVDATGTSSSPTTMIN
ncbi:hypothetical protein BAE44_0014404, partial [Dichanthelium oligosanthes]